MAGILSPGTFFQDVLSKKLKSSLSLYFLVISTKCFITVKVPTSNRELKFCMLKHLEKNVPGDLSAILVET